MALEAINRRDEESAQQSALFGKCAWCADLSHVGTHQRKAFRTGASKFRDILESIVDWIVGNADEAEELRFTAEDVRDSVDFPQDSGGAGERKAA